MEVLLMGVGALLACACRAVGGSGLALINKRLLKLFLRIDLSGCRLINRMGSGPCSPRGSGDSGAGATMAEVVEIVFCAAQLVAAAFQLAATVDDLRANRALEVQLERVIPPGLAERIKVLQARRVARRPAWDPNRSNCSLCARDYSWVDSLMQHHCRQCGRSMCDDCCEWKEIPEYGWSGEKVSTVVAAIVPLA
jgi:hypothetical protein